MMECFTWGSFPAQHLHLGLHCISANGTCKMKRFWVKETNYVLIFSKVCQLFPQLLYLEVCCIYRASIADWACHGEVTACIPESRSVALKSVAKEAKDTLQPPTRLLCAHQVSVGPPGRQVLLQQTAWESQTGEMRISLAESWISLFRKSSFSPEGSGPRPFRCPLEGQGCP